MNLPVIEIDNSTCRISLDKRDRVLISITVNKNYFDRDMFAQGNHTHASCWKTLPSYREVGGEIHKTICDYIGSIEREFTREDFVNIDFDDKIAKYDNAINCW